MHVTKQLAKHFRELHFGANWTWVNLKDSLADITWQEATTQISSLNTIVTLVYHTHYYVDAITKVLQGEKLNSKDEDSFNHPALRSQEDWKTLLDKVWKDAENFATLVEQLPENKLWETFSEEKYGNYYRNIQGIIEHTHYHLGQIVIIKKMIRQKEKPAVEKSA